MIRSLSREPILNLGIHAHYWIEDFLLNWFEYLPESDTDEENPVSEPQRPNRKEKTKQFLERLVLSHSSEFQKILDTGKQQIST
ncbi:MAG: hypothetical protein GY795_07500 [Desulfobacterales bacterium]|nr:hypothetical protein [Desulfobacterales bacterium]